MALFAGEEKEFYTQKIVYNIVTMKNDNNIKILWLSDIHFSEKYSAISANEDFKNYFEQFRIKVDREHTAESPIEYVFLTGDLAQAGTKEDYALFWSMFLKPLLDIFISKKPLPFPKVITIPGNHDVKWSSADFLNDYLDHVDPILNPDKFSRSEYLKSKATDFKHLFQDYQDFIKIEVKSQDGGKYKDFFDFTGNPEIFISTSYSDTRLYGYIVDKKRKAIFVLFNTAWFSLGDKFNDLFASEIITADEFSNIKSGNISYLKDYINKGILKKKDYITEFSNQITGVNIFDCNDLYKELDEYQDFLVVSCMHHPLNWLDWDEYNSYEMDNTETNAYKLRTLLGKSDIVLSGHEHIPLIFSPELIFKNTVHLKSGCFLFDNQHSNLSLSHSWFTILNIDSDRGLLSQKKYFYVNTSTEQNWKNTEPEDIVLSKKNDRYILRKSRKESILSQLSTCKEDKLFHYINHRFAHSVQPTGLMKIATPADIPFFVYTTTPVESGEYYFVSQSDNFYTSINNDRFFEYIDSLVHNSKNKPKIIRIIVLDLFVDSPVKSEYEATNLMRYQVLQRILKRADNLFDVVRHNFFMRFEQSGPNLPAQVDNFRKFHDLCFVNHVIPYWIFEKYWS